MRLGLILWVSLMTVAYRQSEFIFDGQADLAEADGVKAKALEIARQRAVQKAAEYVGMKVDSKTVVKDFVVQSDEIVSKGEVEEVKEIYADWDRGDTSRVIEYA